MRRRIPVLIGVWLLSGWIASCGDDSVPDHPFSRVAGTPVNQDHDGDRVILRMQGSPPGQGIRSLDALAAAREELAGSVRGMLADMDLEAATVRALPLLGLAVIRMAGNPGDVIPRLTSHPQVQRAELSRQRPLHDGTAEPLFCYQWGLENTADPQVEEELKARTIEPLNMTAGADVGARPAWRVSDGSPEVIVAILDSGVDYTHADLAPSMWFNSGEIPCNGIDDDGNGYVDDYHGWNAFADNGDPMDNMGHGSHVAGIVAAAVNGRGTSGVAPRTRLLAVCVTDPKKQWEDDAAIITGIEYILTLHRVGVNIRVVNVSLGGPGKSAAFHDAFSALESEGIIAVCSTGNGGTCGDLLLGRYPVNYPLANILSVGAGDPSDSPAGFSNFGEYSTDIFAPGVAILSTVPKFCGSSDSWSDGGFYWSLASGTSMAAPMVAGAVALAAGVHPGADWRQLKDLVLLSGKRLRPLAGYGRRQTRMDLAAMVESPLPDEPILYRASDMLLSPGDTTTLLGHNLGGSPGTVSLDGTRLRVLSWKADAVSLRLPRVTCARDPRRVIVLRTAEGRAASMPLYVSRKGGREEVTVGETGECPGMVPYDGKMATLGPLAYGVVRCESPAAGGGNHDPETLAWGRLDLRTNRLDYLGELPEEVTDWGSAAMAALGEYVYCAGSVQEERVLRYHVPSGRWDSTTPQPMNGLLTNGPVMTSDGESLFLTGGMVQGQGSGGDVYLNQDVYRFSPESGQWKRMGTWGDFRFNVAALATGRKLLLCGGTSPMSIFIPQAPCDKCDILDIRSGRWIRTVMPVGNAHGVLTRVGDTLYFLAPRDSAGLTTPYALTLRWPPRDGRRWSIHPVHFDFVDLDRRSAWAARCGAVVSIIGYQPGNSGDQIKLERFDLR